MKKDKRNSIIVALLVTIMFMSIGYALLSNRVDDNTDKISTAMVSSYKDVEITTINSIAAEGTAEDLGARLSGKTSITVKPVIRESKDKVMYTVNVKNKGTKASLLKDIEIVPEEEEYYRYVLENINAGDILNPGESLMFTFTVEYNDDYQFEDVKDEAKEITLTLNYEK